MESVTRSGRKPKSRLRARQAIQYPKDIRLGAFGFRHYGARKFHQLHEQRTWLTKALRIFTTIRALPSFTWARRSSCASARRRPSTIPTSSSTWAATTRSSAPIARPCTSYDPSLKADEARPAECVWEARRREPIRRAEVSGLSIAVVGAGIGGLTAALALARQGHEITLVERRTGFSEVGAGLQLSPNASRILIELGSGNALRRVATEPERRRRSRHRSGREIGAGRAGGFHAPALRSALLGRPSRRSPDASSSTPCVREPAIRLVMGRTVESVEDGAEASRPLTWLSASGARETVELEPIVGADGIWSQVRAGPRRWQLRRHFAATSPGGRPSTGTASQRSWPATRPACGSVRRAMWCITRSPAGSSSTSSPSRQRPTTGRRLGRAGRSRRPCSPITLRRSGPARPPGDSRRNGCAGRCSTIPSSASPRAASPCSAMPPIRSCPFLAQGAALAIEDAATLACLLT